MQDALLDIIATKKNAFKTPRKGKAKGGNEGWGGNVIDIMEAMCSSLGIGAKAKRA